MFTVDAMNVSQLSNFCFDSGKQVKMSPWIHPSQSYPNTSEQNVWRQ